MKQNNKTATKDIITKAELKKAFALLYNKGIISQKNYRKIIKFLNETKIVLSDNGDFYKKNDSTIAMPKRNRTNLYLSIANIVLQSYISNGYSRKSNVQEALLWYLCFLWASQAIRILEGLESSEIVTIDGISFETKFINYHQLYYMVELLRKRLNIDQVTFANLIFDNMSIICIYWAYMRGISRFKLLNIIFKEEILNMSHHLSLYSRECSTKRPNLKNLAILLQRSKQIEENWFSAENIFLFKTSKTDQRLDFKRIYGIGNIIEE